MKRFFVAVAVIASVVLAGPFARAQPQQQAFGDKGQFIIDADRLMPLLTYTHFSRDEPPIAMATGASHSGDNTTLGLFYGSTLDLNNPGNTDDFPSSAFFAVPRLGLDYVFMQNMTIGGNLIIFGTLGGGVSTQETATNGFATTGAQQSQQLSLFGIAPRFGYIMKMSDAFSLWLRGGLSFYNGTLTTSGANGTLVTDSQHQFALDLEPQLVYTAIPHVGFTASVDADLSPSFAGGYTHNDKTINVSTSRSSDVVFLGITLGMIAYF